MASKSKWRCDCGKMKVDSLCPQCDSTKLRAHHQRAHVLGARLRDRERRSDHIGMSREEADAGAATALRKMRTRGAG